MALSVNGLRVLKIQTKTLLNMKMEVKYLNFVFHIEVKTKSNYKKSVHFKKSRVFQFRFKIEN